MEKIENILSPLKNTINRLDEKIDAFVSILNEEKYRSAEPDYEVIRRMEDKIDLCESIKKVAENVYYIIENITEEIYSTIEKTQKRKK